MDKDGWNALKIHNLTKKVLHLQIASILGPLKEKEYASRFTLLRLSNLLLSLTLPLAFIFHTTTTLRNMNKSWHSELYLCIYSTSVFCWWLLIESNKMSITILYNELLPSPLFCAFDLAWTYVPYCSRLFILKVLFLSPHSPHSIFHFNFQKTGKAASTETYSRLVIKPYIIALQLVVII